MNLLPHNASQGLRLGKKFTHNCVIGSITGLSTSWWTNSTLFLNDNSIKFPPLHPSDNNTIYTCIITIQQNPYGCPQNQSREYIITLESEKIL